MKEGVWNKRSGKGVVFGQNGLSVDQGVMHSVFSPEHTLQLNLSTELSYDSSGKRSTSLYIDAPRLTATYHSTTGHL